MIALLWAKQIMLGNKTFSQTPPKLADKVAEILIENGHEELTKS